MTRKLRMPQLHLRRPICISIDNVMRFIFFVQRYGQVNILQEFNSSMNSFLQLYAFSTLVLCGKNGVSNCLSSSTTLLRSTPNYVSPQFCVLVCPTHHLSNLSQNL